MSKIKIPPQSVSTVLALGTGIFFKDLISYIYLKHFFPKSLPCPGSSSWYLSKISTFVHVVVYITRCAWQNFKFRFICCYCLYTWWKKGETLKALQWLRKTKVDENPLQRDLSPPTESSLKVLLIHNNLQGRWSKGKQK